MMSSASLNLPWMLLRLVEVHAFFSITYADNHTNLRNNMATEALNTLQIYVVIFCLVLTGHCAEDFKDIRWYVKYYETLSYDRTALLQQHHRVRRHLAPETQVLHLDFEAFQKVFRLRLKPDFEGFAEDFKVLSSNQSWKGDLSHIYSGVLEDEVGSSCQGSILEGQFEGSIKTSNGTFYVETMQRYTSESTDNHSVIYHEDDIDDVPMVGGHAGFCGTDRLQSLFQSLRQDEPVPRSKRTVDQSKTSCLLHLHVDYLFYQRFGSIESVVAQVASYMKAVNNIFHKAEFDGIDVIDFKVKSMKFVLELNPDDVLQETFIGPEKLLSLYSEMNWGNYCLSYLLTNRDFNGVLGLAWEGKPDNWGGICSKPIHMDGQSSSLNTGLITLKNFGRYLLPKFVQLTFAHELGHSLGAPHDEGSDCGDLGVTEGKGYFLMFPHAADEVKENTDRFSPCSLRHMSRLLKIKKDNCFVVSNQPICGNRITEKGEECDVGLNANDPCCYSSKEPIEIQCRLKPNKQCSPSQGFCCSSGCVFKTSGQLCEEDSECRMKSMCSGISATCPQPAAKPNLTVCSLGTRVCHNGECSRSLCVLHGLEQCDCPGENKKEKCHMCCQQRGNPKTCASTTSSVLSVYFKGQQVSLLPGSPCYKNQGYCDHFQTCRLLDADGPIARLKNVFLNLREYDDVADWMKAHWWAILLGILGVSALMAGIVCLFGRTPKSVNKEETTQ
ncbi:disintegrin and metalloproteinase domain-containing protein 10 [Tachysurus vachellii]|uniref:disintegrin and metalloproteinase domain-containing protein 10 n=1 Tax=Tachysurus vachellii TaxID=175792 RepID=UPI00296B2BB1|nr:disintegrin and metalloproteinase domain-containing protein 10 [Tachysurus vachellii]